MIAMASNGHLQQESTDKNRREWRSSLFDADTTTYTQDLGNKGDLVGRFDFDTQFSWSNFIIGYPSAQRQEISAINTNPFSLQGRTKYTLGNRISIPCIESKRRTFLHS